MVELEIKPTAGMRMRVFGIILLAAILSLILVYLLTGGKGELFAPKTDIYTFLPDATGVTTSSPVLLSGIQIGTVTTVGLSERLDPQHAVRVVMSIKARYLKDIPIDSTTAVNAQTMVGYKFIDINEGKSAAPLPPNGVLESEPPAKTITDRANLMQALADELRQVDSMLTTVSDPNSPVGHFVAGEQEYDTALQKVENFDKAVRTFVAPQNSLAQMLFTNTLYDQLHTKAVGIDGSLAAIQRGEGAAGHLYLNDEEYQEFARTVRELRDSMARLTSGQGAAGALLTSDDAYKKVSAALDNIDRLFSDLNEGHGVAGRLLRSPDLYESLNGSLRNLAVFLRDFREHPEKYLRYQAFHRRKGPPAAATGTK